MARTPKLGLGYALLCPNICLPGMQVSDIIVSAAFLGEANDAERCGVNPIWARTFAVFSVFFILMPLILTALFITGVQRRSFVYRKQLHALQMSMADVAPGAPQLGSKHKPKQSFGADVMSANFTQQNISNTSADLLTAVIPLQPHAAEPSMHACALILQTPITTSMLSPRMYAHPLRSPAGAPQGNAQRQVHQHS